MNKEAFIRDYFAAWQNRDWNFVENSLAEGFTFTSPHDSYLNCREYKEKCWDSITEMKDYKFISIIEKGDEAFVRYKGQVNGENVQNAEHFIFENGKLKTVTVFFGRPDDNS